MAFFELPEVKAKPRRRRRRRRVDDEPSWGPPSLMLPGRLPGDFVLATSDEQAVIVQAIECYPTGFQFELRTISKYDYDEDDAVDAPDLFAWAHRMRRGEPPPTLLRFGVAFADGRKGTTLDARRGPHDDRGGLPFQLGGGGGGGGTWQFNIWINELPPDGPVGFVCEWPAFGIPETRRSIPGARIRRAAERARPVF